MSVPIRVIIVTHDQPEALERVLRSLGDCHFPGQFKGTIIVENGGSRASESIAGKASPALACRWIKEDSPSKCVALNAALKLISPNELAVFFDDDVRVSPNILAQYSAAATEYGPNHYFGGKGEVDYEAPPLNWLIPWLPPSARGYDPVDNPAGEFRWFLGFNWAAFAGDLERAGGFPEFCGPGTDICVGDESSMQQKLHENGLKSQYIGKAVVWHHVPKNRCSPDWLLRRCQYTAFLQGVLARLRANESPAAPSRIREALRHVWKANRRFGKAMPRSLGCTKFRSVWTLRSLRGFLAGWKREERNSTFGSYLNGSLSQPGQTRSKT
jgi:hypothetical protein